MGVFTFVCRCSGHEWSAKQLSGELEASASSTYNLQRRLVQAALSTDSSGGVQSSFSLITPSSAVFQPLKGFGDSVTSFSLLDIDKLLIRSKLALKVDSAYLMRSLVFDFTGLDNHDSVMLTSVILIGYTLKTVKLALKVIVGGGGGGGAFIGGAAAGAASGGGAPAAEAPPAEEKVEEKEESDEEMGFSLFDD
ncbi:hypothetical protein HHK36_021028 [Tetracentron sinense]|uniref:Uncharacterized protein n=1 Tax=Tetracentron sinense TaxID=13715 RepID=A0A835D7F9_TETSI|nr:hypothetical protein HHK36_021028 [Tetracentron sinense]